jgi:hypothetical protein
MTTITDPGSARIQAIFLKGHCQLMAKGMTHSRISKTKVLQLAGDITGVKYKRGQHAQAAEDLKKYIEESRRADL